MRFHSIIKFAVLIASLAFMFWTVAPSVQAADPVSQEKSVVKAKAKVQKTATVAASTAPTSSENGRTGVASGAVEDSQMACLERIPKNASAGQRMLAENSCTRDQGDRR